MTFVSVLGACCDPRRPMKWQILQQDLYLPRETNFCSLLNALGRYPWWNHKLNKNPRTDQSSVCCLKFQVAYLQQEQMKMHRKYATSPMRTDGLRLMVSWWIWGIISGVNVHITGAFSRLLKTLTNIVGSSLTRTTGSHPFANGMIENLTRELRDVLIVTPKSTGAEAPPLFCWASAVRVSKTFWHNQ